MWGKSLVVLVLGVALGGNSAQADQAQTAKKERGCLWSAFAPEIPADCQGILNALIGQYDQAIANFTEAIRLDPKNAALYALRGWAHEQKDEHDKAIIDFNESIRLDPGNSQVYYWRGNAYSELGAVGKAIADCSQALRLDPHNDLARACRGWAYAQKGDYQKGLQDLDEVLRTDPQNVTARQSRAYVFMFKGDVGKAISECDEAVRLEPNDYSGYASRSMVHFANGEIAKGLADYATATKLNPKEMRLMKLKFDIQRSSNSVLIGVGFGSEGYWGLPYMRFGQIAGDCTKILAKDDNNLPAHYARAYAYYCQGKYDEAITDYNAVLRLDANDAEAYFERGTCFGEKQDYGKAIADLTEAIRLKPGNALAHCSRAWAYQQKGEYGKARAGYAESVRIDPDYADGYRYLAWLLATCPDDGQRDGTKAVECATKACELHQWKDAVSLDTLATAYAEHGQFDVAIVKEKEALKLAPADERGYYQSRLDLYRAGKPFRGPRPEPATNSHREDKSEQ